MFSQESCVQQDPEEVVSLNSVGLCFLWRLEFPKHKSALSKGENGRSEKGQSHRLGASDVCL